MKSQLKLYIVAKIPLVKEIKDQLLEIFNNKSLINILWFRNYSCKKEKIFKQAFPNNKLTFKSFNFKNPKESILELDKFDTYYFDSSGALSYYREFLIRSNVEEPKYFLIGHQKFPPVTMVLKKKNKYHKLLTIQRGNDDSIYINFEGEYLASKYYTSNEIIKGISNIKLDSVKGKFYSPHISYHPKNGEVHSKDKLGYYFIPNLKANDIRDIENNKIFPFLSLITHFNFDNLKDIGPPPLNQNFNFIELDKNPPKIIKDGIPANTFIIINLDIIGKNQDLYLDFWLHKNLSDVDVLDSLYAWQKINMYNCLTINNKLSNISITILFKSVSSQLTPNQILIILFSEEKYFICTLKKIIPN